MAKKSREQKYEDLVKAISAGELGMAKFLWDFLEEVEGVSGSSEEKVEQFQKKIDEFIARFKDRKDGKDGKDGYSPKKGKDFFDGKDGKDGRDGRDGRDGVDGVGFDGKDGKDGKAGPMPKHEWNGSKIRFEISPDEWGAWVDLRGPMGPAGMSYGPGEGGHGGHSGLEKVTAAGFERQGVHSIYFGDNLTVSRYGNGVRVDAEAGGGVGSGNATIVRFETPSGTVNDVNTIFTVTQVPLYIVVNGFQLFEDAGYTRAGLSITLDNPVGSTGWIRSAYESNGVETPSGTVDDSNMSFTVENEPLFVVVNGAKLLEGLGYSYSAGTITLDNPVGTNGFIRSVFQDGINNEVPVEIPDDSNTIFTLSNEPRYVVVNGAVLFDGAGYSYSAGEIDLNNAVGENGTIRSVY